MESGRSEEHSRGGDGMASHGALASVLFAAAPASRMGRRSMIAVIAFTCMILIVAEAWLIQSSREREMNAAQANLDNLARTLTEYSVKTFEMVSVALDVAAALAPKLGRTDQANTFTVLSNLLAGAPSLHLIAILDEKGDLSFDTLGYKLDPPPRSVERDYFSHHRDNPSSSLLVGVPGASQFDDSIVMTASRRLTNPDGTFGGVVIVEAYVSAMQAFFRTLNIGVDGAVSLQRDDGVFLIRRPYSPSTVGLNASKGELFSTYLPRSPSGSFAMPAVADGRLRYVSYRRVPGFPLVVAVAMSQAELLADWRREAWIGGLVTAGLVAALILFGFFSVRSAHRREIEHRAVAEAKRRASQQLLDQTDALQKLAIDLEGARRRAEAANNAKTAFLANISHELRTPLNAVVGFAGLLELKITDPKCLTYVSYIVQGGEQLTSRINEILDLAAIESGKAMLRLERVDLQDVLAPALTTLHPMAEEAGVTIVVQPWPGALWVKADRSRLGQVIENLASNGVKYNRPNGVLTVQVDRLALGWVRITFTDTGMGVPAARQDELFGRFNRLGADASAIQGAGIGLSICRDLMSLMKGHIGFNSREGVGSSFWIELPEALPVEEEAHAVTL